MIVRLGFIVAASIAAYAVKQVNVKRPPSTGNSIIRFFLLRGDFFFSNFYGFLWILMLFNASNGEIGAQVTMNLLLDKIKKKKKIKNRLRFVLLQKLFLISYSNFSLMTVPRVFVFYRMKRKRKKKRLN